MDPEREDYADPVSRPRRWLVVLVVLLILVAEVGWTIVGTTYLFRYIQGDG
jgi:hypothetical protein